MTAILGAARKRRFSIPDRSGPGSATTPQVQDQRVEDRHLPAYQFGAGNGLRGPDGVVNLRIAPNDARSAWPFQLEGVAHDPLRFKIRLRGEGRHELARRLPEDAQLVIVDVGRGVPISSANSRLAATSGSSSSGYSPLGIDQERASLWAQKGPPMWAIQNSNSAAEFRRYNRMPALRIVIYPPRHKLSAGSGGRNTQHGHGLKQIRHQIRLRPHGPLHPRFEGRTEIRGAQIACRAFADALRNEV